MDDHTSIDEQHGVPQAVRTCHTALVGGYVVVGHVPVDAIRKMLKERPAIVGIAVPGMPSGSPGMDGPKQPYDIVSFDRNGTVTVLETR